MFKNYFKNLWSDIKTKVGALKKSKAGKVICKAAKIVGKASIIVTAFNLGNITEALAHMSDAPTGFGDTVRWFVILCGEFVKDIKAKNFTWEVKHIFAPFVVAATYIGGKILTFVKNLWGCFSRVLNTVKDHANEVPDTEVVNIFV